jgi:excisionase family DNA binding protein
MTEAVNPPLALRRRDAARALGISERTLWSWTKAGIVPHVRLGSCILYPTDLLRDWLAKGAGNANGGWLSRQAEPLNGGESVPV